MDKTEYNIKLDQINNLLEKQDIQGALEIVETIDWRRVKSVRTLGMVADIYEANKKFEESKEILLLAYNRSSMGKSILYRLVETSVRLDQIDDAIEYYTQYVKNARGDNAKYILKYKIYRAQRAPLEEQIAILEEYKDKEYTERWAYELARLYDRAGMRDKCVEECDDIILWFSEGKYVVKAMELKMKHTPLSPSQMEQYRNREVIAAEPSFVTPEVEIPVAKVEETIKVAEPFADAVTEQVSQLHEEPDIEKEELGEMEAAATVEAVMPLRRSAENLQEKLATGFRDVLSGFNKVKDEVAVGLNHRGTNDKEPEEELEDINSYEVVKDLEPERITNAAPALGTDTKITESEPVLAVKEEVEKYEDPEPETEEDMGITRILESVTLSMAEEIETGSYIQEEAADQEIPEDEEIQEIVLEEENEAEEADLEAQIIRAMEEAEKEVSEAPPEEAQAEPEVVAAPEEPSIEEQILREETQEEKRERILNDTRPEKLSDEQKKVFSYFAKVPGLDQQLLDALNGVYNYAGEKTSKHGNIAIMGAQGTGKTRLSDGLVKAICKDLGLEAAKLAHMNGADMNQKDPAQVVAKMAGGFLMIEKAAAMNEETIEKLSRALEFRTDSMVVMIEDEKSQMRELLKGHEAFAKKFETVISIPVFTNDELVSFARTYAREMGYRIDEMGVLALYTLIGENQTEAEPMNIARVKDMVDQAIQRTQRPGRRFGRKLAVRNTDEDGRVYLYEKDFEF